MGVRSSQSRGPGLNKTDGHLTDYFRSNTFGGGGGGTNTSPPVKGIQATGGAKTYYTDSGTRYAVHTFTATNPFQITETSQDSSIIPNRIDYLVIGGGGAGGDGAGGGGGAGGYRTGTINHPEGPATIPVTVGPGGSSENNGSPSVFNHPTSPITSNAGGKGGNEAGNGGPGGSGGGAGGVTSGGAELTAGSATPPGQGNNGSEGWASTGAEATGGGGGGAGGVGRDINGVDARANGGLGIQLPSTFQDPSNPSGATGPGGGSPGFWVAGGGGAAQGTAPGTGYGGSGTEDAGPFAGGGAGVSSGTGNAGTANTGGGGGGGTSDGGAGGSGLVLIAYDA